MNPDAANDVIDYVDALLDESALVPAAAPPLASDPGPPATALEAELDAAPDLPAAPPAVAVAAPDPVRSTASPAIAPGPVAARPLMAPAPGPSARIDMPEPSSGPITQSSRWLRVMVGRDSYALELLRVQEVVRVVPIVAMRGAKPSVLGVMNLRGRIVPVFDLGLWLGTGQVEAGEQSRIVVVERDDELVGVLVSAVEDVVTLGRDRIEPPVQGSAPGVILGVARVGAAPTVLFDAYALYG